LLQIKAKPDRRRHCQEGVLRHHRDRPDGGAEELDPAQGEAAPKGAASPSMKENSMPTETLATCARPALAAVAAAYRDAPCSVGLDCDPELRAAPEQVEALGCLAAEAVAAALGNPLGAPAHVWIHLERDGARLRLRVRDDGPGVADLEADPRRALIASMAERMGGRIKQGSAAFGGGEVVTTFPARRSGD
jgi:hypothetical protein